jgi:hypothetical protein
LLRPGVLRERLLRLDVCRLDGAWMSMRECTLGKKQQFENGLPVAAAHLAFLKQNCSLQLSIT